MPESTADHSRTHTTYLSLGLLCAMHAACLLVFVVPFSATVVWLAVGGYLLRMWAITAGYHRYFSHRSYKTSRAFQFVLAVIGTSAMENGPLWWASWHRNHHRWSDQPADPHSPLQRGFWHAHLGWILDSASDRPDLSNVSDLSRYPELRFLEQHKWWPLVAYAALCYWIGGVSGLVWGGVLSSVLVLHATALINSLGHRWGTRPYPTPDGSRNNAALAVLTLGEGWHNNHHHAMYCARQGFRWWEIDLTYYSLRLLAAIGVIWSIREPTHRRRPYSAAPASLTPHVLPSDLEIG
jgi:stearoyl-CoA desaturase (delta-9 desaturase)